MDLVTLWVVVETLVEGEALLVEVVAGASDIEEVRGDIRDLEVVVTTMVVVLVVAVEDAMVASGQDMDTKEADAVAVVEDMMVTIQEIILDLTMVVVGTIRILEIRVDNSNQIMGP